MKNSVGSRTTAAGNMGAAIVAHVARSDRSRIDAVICNWKQLQCFCNHGIPYICRERLENAVRWCQGLLKKKESCSYRVE